MPTSVWSVGLSFVAAFLGAWFAARFALYRFYRERVWEKKTVAYSEIFAALHGMGRWFDAHVHEATSGRELGEVAASHLSAEYGDAKAELERRLDSELWLIPTECRKRAEHLMRDLARRGDDWDWNDMLANGQAAIESANDDLRRLARIDLGLERKSWKDCLYI